MNRISERTGKLNIFRGEDDMISNKAVVETNKIGKNVRIMEFAVIRENVGRLLE